MATVFTNMQETWIQFRSGAFTPLAGYTSVQQLRQLVKKLHQRESRSVHHLIKDVERMRSEGRKLQRVHP